MWNLKKRKVKLTEIESGKLVARDLGWGNKEKLIKGYKLSFFSE